MKFISCNDVCSKRRCLNAVNFVNHQPKEGCACGTISGSHPQPGPRRTCEAAASASLRAPELSLPRAQGHQAERSRETPPYAQAEEPPGPAAAPQPRPRLSGRHSRRSRLLLRLLRGAGPGRRAPPLPRAGSAAGGPGSGPLCAAAGCECGPGREAAGSAWPLPLGERDRRPPIAAPCRLRRPARASAVPEGEASGRRRCEPFLILFSSGVCRVAAGWPG